MAACTPSIHVFLGRPLFLLSIGTHSIINFGILPSGYEIMWKNIVEPERPQMTVWRVHLTCWVTTAVRTNTQSEYVTHIDFPLQQCLHGRASLLRYTYIAVFFILAVDSQVSPLRL